jgi:galactoside O-acetyltransferase
MKKTHASITGSGSSLKKYQEVIVGSHSLIFFLYYEWCMFLGSIPGALGFALRKLFWPRMFGSCEKGCMFGAHVVVRHPGRMRLGKSVVISDGCVLDGRHSSADTAVRLGENVILSNNVMISCKDGTVEVGNNVGLNAHTIIQSTNDCPVTIGEDCVIGQGCLVIGGGNYNLDRLDIPIREQGIKPDGGVCLERDVWLGGNVTVLGGVTVGQSSVAAAGAVLTRSVPEKSICMGVPARVVRTRSTL